MKNLKNLGKVLNTKEQKSVFGGGFTKPYLASHCMRCNPSFCSSLAPRGYYAVCVPCTGPYGGEECRIYKS